MTSATRQQPATLRTISTAFVLLWMILAAFPFLWTLWGSFKVQGDFFSRQDWTYAIYGVRTIAETGSAFTGRGYDGAWIFELAPAADPGAALGEAGRARERLRNLLTFEM